MPVKNPTLVQALENELAEVRKRIDEEGAYADSIRSLIAQAKGQSSNGATSAKPKPSRRKRDRSAERAVPAEKLEALHSYLLQTQPAGHPFTAGDLSGWQGFEALGISGSRVPTALNALATAGKVQQASRAEYQGELAGPRTKVWKVVPA